MYELRLQLQAYREKPASDEIETMVLHEQNDTVAYHNTQNSQQTEQLYI